MGLDQRVAPGHVESALALGTAVSSTYAPFRGCCVYLVLAKPGRRSRLCRTHLASLCATDVSWATAHTPTRYHHLWTSDCDLAHGAGKRASIVGDRGIPHFGEKGQ